MGGGVIGKWEGARGDGGGRGGRELYKGGEKKGGCQPEEGGRVRMRLYRVMEKAVSREICSNMDCIKQFEDISKVNNHKVF